MLVFSWFLRGLTSMNLVYSCGLHRHAGTRGRDGIFPQERTCCSAKGSSSLFWSGGNPCEIPAPGPNTWHGCKRCVLVTLCNVYFTFCNINIVTILPVRPEGQAAGCPGIATAGFTGTQVAGQPGHRADQTAAPVPGRAGYRIKTKQEDQSISIVRTSVSYVNTSSIFTSK